MLSPSGLVSLRLSNPKHSMEFDRAPRVTIQDEAHGVTSQSSGSLVDIYMFKQMMDTCRCKIFVSLV